ncbi:MAG: acetoin:2,6-dichlorophenolindophenol oxidoreductase subunit alpha [Bradyrhizobium sp.]|nr:acetoin:2,6-dichlorophenolindophenol oxidoreductase subunit alpha [Bradyrhizobium sp.]
MSSRLEDMGKLSDEDLECLLRIRLFETCLLQLFSQGQLSGTTHTCLGQEYIPVALRTLIEPCDFVFSNHRGHGHYIARFGDAEGLLAEITGRQGAICHGVGGSQHIYRPGSYLSTGIQGQGLGVAAGVAGHFKRCGSNELAVAYVGDGTWGQGIVYEVLNLAALWQLPLALIVENNGIAQSTPTALQMAGNIEARVRAFGIEYEEVTSTDITEIRRLLAPSFLLSRKRRSPVVITFETMRLGPHSKGDDTRTADEIARARQRDVLTCYEVKFPEQYAAIRTRVDDEITTLARRVLDRPPSTWKGLCA